MGETGLHQRDSPERGRHSPGAAPAKNWVTEPNCYSSVLEPERERPSARAQSAGLLRDERQGHKSGIYILLN